MHERSARCRRVSVDRKSKRWTCTCGESGETRPRESRRQTGKERS